jgi:hypothetical protein
MALGTRLFLASLVALPAFAAAVGKPQGDRRETAQAAVGASSQVPRSAENRGTETAPIFVRQLRSQADEQREAEDRQDKKTVDERLVWFTGVLAFFTALLACLTGWLAWETLRLRRLSTQQSSDTQASLQLTRRSLDFATALELPIFVVEAVDIDHTKITAIVRFGNHGRTPAVILADCLVLEVTPALPDKPRYPLHTVNEVQVARIVDPHNSYDCVRQSSPARDSWDPILKIESILWAYGYLSYRDFQSRRHRVGFCFAFEPRPDRMYPISMPSRGDWIQQGPSRYTYHVLDDGEPSEYLG